MEPGAEAAAEEEHDGTCTEVDGYVEFILSSDSQSSACMILFEIVIEVLKSLESLQSRFPQKRDLGKVRWAHHQQPSDTKLKNDNRTN